VDRVVSIAALHGTRAEHIPANMRSLVKDVDNDQQNKEAPRESVQTNENQAINPTHKQKTAATQDVDMTDFVEDYECEKEVVLGKKGSNKTAEKEKENGKKDKKGKGKETAARVRAATKCPFEKTAVAKGTPSGKDGAWASNAATWMRTLEDDVNPVQSKALQNLLLHMFSVEAVGHAAVLAEHTRANANTMQAAVAVGSVKTVTDSSFAADLLQTEASTLVAEFELLIAHTTTAQLLTSFVDGILASTSPLCEEHQKAVSVERHPYLTAGTRASVHKYVIDQSTLSVFEENATGSRAGVEKKVSNHARGTIEKVLRISESLMWLADAFGSGSLVLIATHSTLSGL
jgi:hypothetical protein